MHDGIELDRRGVPAAVICTDQFVASAQAQAGDSEAALASVAQIRGFPPPPEMWRALGVTEGRRGNVDAVLPRGPAERDEERRAEFLMGLAEGLMARAGGARQP